MQRLNPDMLVLQGDRFETFCMAAAAWSDAVKFQTFKKAVRYMDEELVIRKWNGFPHLRIVKDYQMPNVSEKVARIILSYTDYVNRVAWRKC